MVGVYDVWDSFGGREGEMEGDGRREGRKGGRGGRGGRGGDSVLTPVVSHDCGIVDSVGLNEATYCCSSFCSSNLGIFRAFFRRLKLILLKCSPSVGECSANRVNAWFNSAGGSVECELSVDLVGE